jgi:large subunit ribosomal protein L5
VFPEIDYARIDKVRGLEITIVTSADNDVQAKLLLEKLGMPFEKN